MGKELGDLAHVAKTAKNLLAQGKPAGIAAQLARQTAEARAGYRERQGELKPEFLMRAEQSILRVLKRHFRAL